MKFIKENITTILIIVVAVLGTILFMNLFSGKQVVPDTGYKERLEDKEAIIKAKEETINVLSKANEYLDESIQSQEKRDSLLLVSIANNQPKYKANDKKLQDVHVAVIDLNKEQLRSELTGF